MGQSSCTGFFYFVYTVAGVGGGGDVNVGCKCNISPPLLHVRGITVQKVRTIEQVQYNYANFSWMLQWDKFFPYENFPLYGTLFIFCLRENSKRESPAPEEGDVDFIGTLYVITTNLK